MTIQDLAEAAHAAYQAAPQDQRWQAVAAALLERVDEVLRAEGLVLAFREDTSFSVSLVRNPNALTIRDIDKPRLHGTVSAEIDDADPT